MDLFPVSRASPVSRELLVLAGIVDPLDLLGPLD